MHKLEEYKFLEFPIRTKNNEDKFNIKKNYFKSSNDRPFVINHIAEFDRWYRLEAEKINEDFRFIYRGMSDAKYKLYNSAQRFWILHALNDWKGKSRISYLQMIKFMLKRGREDKLFKKVFEFYKLSDWQTDFPQMSILQHYGCPTPLIDWTYNLDVALYFATEYINYKGGQQEISDYFSINIIDKNISTNLNLENIKNSKKTDFPSLEEFFSPTTITNTIYYVSDFEDEKIDGRKSSKNKQYTTIFNQNIIPQEGLLIFNPEPNTPLEEYIRNIGINQNDSSLYSINIHKHVAEYVRRRLKKKGITKEYIYPQLELNAKSTIDNYLSDISVIEGV